MKIEVKENAVFQPIELKLVIETEEELCDLWHRLNIDAIHVNANSDMIKHRATNVDFGLFYVIDELVTKYNLNDEAE
jgi:hypothetical protein